MSPHEPERDEWRHVPSVWRAVLARVPAGPPFGPPPLREPWGRWWMRLRWLLTPKGVPLRCPKGHKLTLRRERGPEGWDAMCAALNTDSPLDSREYVAEIRCPRCRRVYRYRMKLAGLLD